MRNKMYFYLDKALSENLILLGIIIINENSTSAVFP
jgi:hypothetical protein